MKKSLLLCEPSKFDVVYKINPWMDPSLGVHKTTAMAEWKELKSIYKDLGLAFEIMNQADNLPDMVFTANGFFSINKKAIVARFRYKERQGETAEFKGWLEEHGYTVIDPGNTIYEGEGDTFVVSDKIFQGWGFRSDREIIPVFKKAYPDKTIVPLHLINDKFYHLDTCFFPVNKELVYYYEKAFDMQSIKRIQTAFKKAVEVSDEEAHTFSLNSVTTDHTVVTNNRSKKFGERVKAEGYRVIYVPMTEFFKSGGSVKCLTNEIFENETNRDAN